MQKSLFRWLPKWVIPSFFIGMTLLILIFNDVFGEQDAFVVFSLVFFTLMALAILRWLFIQVQYILKLKKEKKEAELMHLKSQVNPHFFFNTLNNLYGLVGQDTMKAQALILKLSDMMRYSIYEGQNEWVTLGQEIEYLEAYIDLNKMRYHKTIAVHFEVDVEDRSVQVMPLLFIILLENAFKHGVENLRKGAFVNMELKAYDGELDFQIENNFDAEELNGIAGIGLANLRRRLELVYPGKHDLASSVNDDVYKASLKLKLR